MEESQEDLEKVYVDLPNHWAVGGESMWAKPLGNNLFEIRNTPFYAYGLNWGDVVRAESAESNFKPEVLEFVKYDGNKILQIYFAEQTDENVQTGYLETLKQFKVSYERANYNLIALDIEPEADYDAVCAKLWKSEQKGILEYETCESRMQNRFDEEPQD